MLCHMLAMMLQTQGIAACGSMGDALRQAHRRQKEACLVHEVLCLPLNLVIIKWHTL